ncbi:MAG: hypothetical protein HOW73_39095 [Polyangiaceae bacterium]|nr:hypothetical protein [Polyangiaceae bacterium]
MSKLLPLNPDSPDVELVDPARAMSLLAVRRGEISPTVPTLPKVVGGMWHECDLAQQETAWTWRDGELDLFITSPFADDNGLGERFEVLNRPARLILETGDVLEARLGDLSARGGSINLQKGFACRTHTLSLASWTWRPNTPKCIWVGELDAKIGDGNLVLCDRALRDSGHLRLRGAYDLYLVRRCSGGGVIVVDTGGRELDHSALAIDFAALEFALGQSLELTHLTAFADDGSIVGAAGLGFDGLGRSNAGRRPPAADRRDLNALSEESIAEYRWVPVLFERVAERLRRDGEDSPLSIPIAAYLDSLSGRIHASYLMSQVALEAFASALVESQGSLLVKDSKAWLRFVDERRHELVEHAIDEQAARRLVNKVKNAQQAPSTDRVHDALRHLELDVPKEALTEVERRNAVAHRYVMAKESTADVQALADRLAIVQTLLVALVAKYVGYDGPIVGWEWIHGRRRVPSWWDWKRSPEARRRYLALDPSLVGEDGDD